VIETRWGGDTKGGVFFGGVLEKNSPGEISHGENWLGFPTVKKMRERTPHRGGGTPDG